MPSTQKGLLRGVLAGGRSVGSHAWLFLGQACPVCCSPEGAGAPCGMQRLPAFGLCGAVGPLPAAASMTQLVTNHTSDAGAGNEL